MCLCSDIILPHTEQRDDGNLSKVVLQTQHQLEDVMLCLAAPQIQRLGKALEWDVRIVLPPIPRQHIGPTDAQPELRENVPMEIGGQLEATIFVTIDIRLGGLIPAPGSVYGEDRSGVEF